MSILNTIVSSGGVSPIPFEASGYGSGITSMYTFNQPVLIAFEVTKARTSSNQAIGLYFPIGEWYIIQAICKPSVSTSSNIAHATDCLYAYGNSNNGVTHWLVQQQSSSSNTGLPSGLYCVAISKLDQSSYNIKINTNGTSGSSATISGYYIPLS